MSLPAGWYTDPVDANVERYWDGTAWENGPEAVRGQPGGSYPALTTEPPTPKPSASLLVAGLVCLVLGLIIATAGQEAQLRAAIEAGWFDDTSSGPTAMIVLGNLAVIVGLVMLVTGVHRLGAGVDHLVRVSADR